MNKAEEKVSKFYNKLGWETDVGITEDARRFEDLRESAKDYLSKCRLRVLRHIPETGENILDMASGPIQYEEYLEYSKNFKKRYCVDLSSTALEDAKKKIGDHGVFLNGSFFDIPLDENFFDCAISLHTIYHIDKDKQEEAVRKLIYVTKPGQPIIVVYSNPSKIFKWVSRLIRLPFLLLRKPKELLEKLIKKSVQKKDLDLYFYTHPIKWWNRFGDVATNIKIMPWRSLNTDIQKCLIPNNEMGKKMFDMIFNLEERFPNFFVKYFCYSMIIITKRKS
jgi:ubiquinone/menaquinone biosynthesis C-methylase UbiE